VDAVILLTLGGFFSIFKPERMQAWFRRQHNGSKFLQNYPFAKLISKPWYPTYLRFMGVWAWMLALFFAYALFSTLAIRQLRWAVCSVGVISPFRSLTLVGSSQ
jgi:hypothetical protein